MTWILTTISLVGNYLNCTRKKACFVLWIICNIGWLWIDIKGQVYSRALLDSVQTGFSIFGYIEWNKHNEQRTNT